LLAGRLLIVILFVFFVIIVIVSISLAIFDVNLGSATPEKLPQQRLSQRCGS